MQHETDRKFTRTEWLEYKESEDYKQNKQKIDYSLIDGDNSSDNSNTPYNTPFNLSEEDIDEETKLTGNLKGGKLTGGNVNYYLIEVPKPKRLEPYTVEVEDLIETLDMSFAEGTVLKSLIRLCKLKQDAGKPGSTYLYEAEKIKYYADRILAKYKID